LSQFATALQGLVRQTQHLKDNAGTVLLYMRFEIVVNPKSRKRTRVAAPPSLPALANEVIE
jgi:hypothetical protein